MKQSADILWDNETIFVVFQTEEKRIYHKVSSLVSKQIKTNRNRIPRSFRSHYRCCCKCTASSNWDLPFIVFMTYLQLMYIHFLFQKTLRFKPVHTLALFVATFVIFIYEHLNFGKKSFEDESSLQLFSFCYSSVRFLMPTKPLLNHSYHLCQAEAPRPNGSREDPTRQ